MAARFANLRAYYGFVLGHPGKKLLLFMGRICPNVRVESRPSAAVGSATGRKTRRHATLGARLNALYVFLARAALQGLEAEGLNGWRAMIATSRCLPGCGVMVWVGEMIVAVNFTPVPRHDYRLGVPNISTHWRECLNSDNTEFQRQRRGQCRSTYPRSGGSA